MTNYFIYTSTSGFSKYLCNVINNDVFVVAISTGFDYWNIINNILAKEYRGADFCKHCDRIQIHQPKEGDFVTKEQFDKILSESADWAELLPEIELKDIIEGKERTIDTNTQS